MLCLLVNVIKGQQLKTALLNNAMYYSTLIILIVLLINVLISCGFHIQIMTQKVLIEARVLSAYAYAWSVFITLYLTLLWLVIRQSVRLSLN